MPAAYDPQRVEPLWYDRWEAAGLFAADPASPKPKYVIFLAPPNVTGVLHMGHAVNTTVQDLLARYRRMQGYEVLFLPGTDHAAIATQNVIERQLAAEGTTKEQIGREAFAARVEQWYASVGQTIVHQLRELGASLDWSRQRFTMDPAYRRAVAVAFARLYEKGWLYRGPRIVNWCPRCRSAISDEEVEWQELHDGLTVEEARTLVGRDLEAGGYLARSEPYTHQVGHCDRCGHVIEPLVSEQWFLKTGELAQRALSASARGDVRWHPARYERTYLDWLRGLDDWCVSRQLWLGHRIPVYTCPEGHRFAAPETPQRCPACGGAPLEQDPDVLDTWFSSALWPFATLGWPDETADLSAFYPTALNGTDRQIINLWVSRMIMCGLELTGQVPFHDVAIHATILSPGGRRMQKSRPETVVDPRDVLGRYGADALRAWCASVAMSTQDVRFDAHRIEGFRRFANKLWNATRLVLSAVPEATGPASGDDASVAGPVLPGPGDGLALADRWILSRLQHLTGAVTRGLDAFDFHPAVDALSAFVWHELCDWYLEAAKPRLRAHDPAAAAVALHALDVVLRLLHPFMPFLTEELWHRLPVPAAPPASPAATAVPSAPALPGIPGSSNTPATPALRGTPGGRDFLVRCPWPAPDDRYVDPEAETGFGRVIELVEAVRRARKEAGAPARGGRLLLDAQLAARLEPPASDLVRRLAVLDAVEVSEANISAVGVVLPGGEGRVEWRPAPSPSGTFNRR